MSEYAAIMRQEPVQDTVSSEVTPDMLLRILDQFTQKSEIHATTT
jgi:hypothetical protein